jgi:hypothetical protein
MDNFVFISHANRDKPLLKPLVQALLGAGLKVWLDRPAGVGYSAQEIERCFYRLRAGGRWEDEVKLAKQKASCILVCWSKRAEGAEALMHHPVWFGEADYGHTEDKLVSCRIDDVNPLLIPNFSAHQMPDVREETERDLIISDVKRVMAQASRQRAGRRGASNGRRSPSLPYLADRSHQEGMVEDALADLIRAGGVRPFFIAGPENECVDEFLKRLEEHTSRRCLGGAMGWEAREVEWPTDVTGEQFAERFGRSLGKSLGRRGPMKPAELVALLAERGRPVAVISRLRADDWKPDEPGRAHAWLGFWRDVAKECGSRAILPLLKLQMPRAKPGWKDVPCGGWFDASGRRNKMIWRELARLAAEFSDLTVALPKVLGPISRDDVDSWCSAHFSLDDDDRLTASDGIAKLFGARDYKRFGAPHAEFAEVMLPLFRGSA